MPYMFKRFAPFGRLLLKAGCVVCVAGGKFFLETFARSLTWWRSRA